MPELPEVEIIRRGILKDLPRTEIKSVKLTRPDLRFPLPVNELKKIKNKKFIDIQRRGKFLIFKTTSSDFISHLGMTGHWRFESKYSPKKHDHVIIGWEKQNLIYNDPRRFGYILNLSQDMFSNFGPDPIEDKIDVNYFTQNYKSINTNIKSFLLNQKNILGIGNIYVSEILFKSKINPLKIVKTLKPEQWEKILSYTHETLTQAIELGGSSLRDYKNVDGKKGDMQNHWLVYGQENKPCSICKSKIKNITISNRSTYFCPKCQK
jgi:formamidopyrimidine-DNA glycosylase